MKTHVAGLIIVIVVATFFVVGAVHGAAQTDPLYNNSTETPANGTWMDNRTGVTLDNSTAFLARFGGFIIGDTGGSVGSILTSFVVGGLVVAMLGTTRVGLVAGGVAAMATGAVLSEGAQLAPRWVFAVAVMLIGFIAAVVYLRMIRG